MAKASLPPEHDRKTVPLQVWSMILTQGATPVLAWRKYLRRTQAGIARDMGVFVRVYQGLEQKKSLTENECRRVAFGLGISFEQLMLTVKGISESVVTNLVDSCCKVSAHDRSDPPELRLMMETFDLTRLKAWRIYRGVPVSVMAHHLGMTPDTYPDFENGESCDREKLKQVAELLGISLIQLVKKKRE